MAKRDIVYYQSKYIFPSLRCSSQLHISSPLRFPSKSAQRLGNQFTRLGRHITAYVNEAGGIPAEEIIPGGYIFGTAYAQWFSSAENGGSLLPLR